MPSKSDIKRYWNHRSEADEQEALFRWAAWAEAQHPELKLLFHIPNGGKRDKVTAARLKSQGVKSGVPDVFLPVARHGKHGLWIELKVPGGSASMNQCQWIGDLKEQGYDAWICYGWEDAKGVIEAYLEK